MGLVIPELFRWLPRTATDATPEVAESMIEIATGMHERYDPLFA